MPDAGNAKVGQSTASSIQRLASIRRYGLHGMNIMNNRIRIVAVTLVIAASLSAPAAAYGWWGKLWIPDCVKEYCCPDYCPKCPPCVAPVCDFCCPDYCPKCPPRCTCPTCPDLKCPPAED